MKNIFALVILSLFCGTYATGDDEAPVYIFTSRNNEVIKPYTAAKYTPFETVQPSELTAILDSYGPETKKIIIVADNLSPEDFHRVIKGGENEKPQRVFQHLPTFKLLEYIQKADAAKDTIYAHYSDSAVHTQFTIGNNFEASTDGSNTIIVPWNSRLDQESDAQFLQRLDNVLGDVVNRNEWKNAVFVLTAAKNPKLNVLSRKVRAADGVDGLFKYDNLLAFYTKAYEYSKDAKKPAVEFKINNIKPDRTTDTELDVVVESANYNIVITLTEVGGTWATTSVKMNDNPVSVYTPIAAPRGFSFACAKSFQVDANNSDIDHIIIQGLQIQPKFKQDTFDLSKFGDAYNCVGFTSPGIWAGIVVTLLLLLIMTIGITALLDIRTMDRFDDPKGKTITVNAND